MSNLSISINLLNIKGAFFRDLKGKTTSKRCIVIPVDDNPAVFVGAKGIYLSLTGVELKERSKFGDTHLVKESYPTEVFKAMSEEEKKGIPIIGNIKPMERKEVAMAKNNESEDYEDLPF